MCLYFKVFLYFEHFIVFKLNICRTASCVGFIVFSVAYYQMRVIDWWSAGTGPGLVLRRVQHVSSDE